VYVDGERLPGSPAPEEAIAIARDKGGSAFAWIGMHEPDATEFGGLAEQLGLHPLAVEDAVHAHQRPKIERYDDSLFAVFKTVRYVASEQPSARAEIVETGEIMVFLGRDFVVTVRHGEHGGLRRAAVPAGAGRSPAEHGAVAIMHAIADRVVDDYLYVAREVQEDIDAVETAVFATTAARTRSGSTCSSARYWSCAGRSPRWPSR